MKNRLQAASMMIVATSLLTATTQAEAVRAPVNFRVERGDTYINLFGRDWEKAYRQNKMTVMRDGKPITSPDILVEGSVISISADVHLSPRAWARVNALRQRRTQLAAKLAALEPRLADNPQAQTAVAECRRLLENDLRFAADVEFAARTRPRSKPGCNWSNAGFSRRSVIAVLRASPNSTTPSPNSSSG